MTSKKDLGIKTHRVNETKTPEAEQPPGDPLLAADKLWANSPGNYSNTSSRWGAEELRNLPSATYSSAGQEGVEILQTKVDSISCSLKPFCFINQYFCGCPFEIRAFNCNFFFSVLKKKFGTDKLLLYTIVCS